MKKKKLIMIASLVVVFFSIAGLYYGMQKNEKKVVKNYKHVMVGAKIDEYQSLQSIEEKVALIVKVKKVNEEEPIIWRDEQGNVYFVGTIGNVEVLKVYKDESDQHIEIGNILPIFENEAYDEKENTTYHVAGYQKMQVENEYMLFLNYSDGDKWYVPCSAIWGKYPLNPQENILYHDSEISTMSFDENLVEKIGVEVIQKYQ